MNRLDDIRRIVEDFLTGLDIVEFTPGDIDGWARELAQAIANELDLPNCDCPSSGHVYPCHDWPAAYGE